MREKTVNEIMENIKQIQEALCGAKDRLRLVEKRIKQGTGYYRKLRQAKHVSDVPPVEPIPVESPPTQ